MKRTLIVVLLCCLFSLCPAGLEAGNFGLKGGVSLMGLRNTDLKLAAGYHAGVTYKFKLPVGFAVQPSLLYHSRHTSAEGVIATADMNVDYLELPVSFQWGPDLLLFRPFVDVSPYVGYALAYDASLQVSGNIGAQLTMNNKGGWGNINRFEYGVGVGGGIVVWKFQLVCRYNWNFGSLLNMNLNGDTDGQLLMEKVVSGKNFGGVTLSLALLF